MRTVTYTNSQNGLSAAFSTDSPTMFLERFNGNSVGASAVTQKPLEFDGQRFISSCLNARTIELAVQFGGFSRDGARYSREAALEQWELLQRVFVPGVMGTLVYSDGTSSRSIQCRTAEFPDRTEILGYLFRAEFSLVADLPLWFDTREQSIELSGGCNVDINNDCGIAVPIIVHSSASAGAIFVMYSAAAEAGLGFISANAVSFTIDTAECTVRSSSGELLNYLLGVESEFFKLLPGDNHISFAGQGASTRLVWHKAYLGVN